MAFNPPLGSTNADVFMGNVQRLDELINGPAADVPDRAGRAGGRKLQPAHRRLGDADARRAPGARVRPRPGDPGDRAGRAGGAERIGDHPPRMAAARSDGRAGSAHRWSCLRPPHMP